MTYKYNDSLVNTEETIVFFDGVCNFCNSSVDFLIRNNPSKDISYASLQSDYAKEVLAPFQIDLSYLSTIYVLKNGRLHKKSGAALRLLPHLKWYFFPLYSFWILPRFIRDWGYDLIANNRYKLLGKRETCRIPTPEEASYFKN